MSLGTTNNTTKVDIEIHNDKTMRFSTEQLYLKSNIKKSTANGNNNLRKDVQSK